MLDVILNTTCIYCLYMMYYIWHGNQSALIKESHHSVTSSAHYWSDTRYMYNKCLINSRSNCNAGLTDLELNLFSIKWSSWIAVDAVCEIYKHVFVHFIILTCFTWVCLKIRVFIVPIWDCIFKGIGYVQFICQCCHCFALYCLFFVLLYSLYMIAHFVLKHNVWQHILIIIYIIYTCDLSNYNHSIFTAHLFLHKI